MVIPSSWKVNSYGQDQNAKLVSEQSGRAWTLEYFHSVNFEKKKNNIC